MKIIGGFFKFIVVVIVIIGTILFAVIGAALYEDNLSENTIIRGGVEYKEYTDDTLCVAAVKDSGMVYIEILEEVDGKPVVAIMSEAFRVYSNLREVIVPASVVSIGYNAFYESESLTDIYYCGSESAWEDMDVRVHSRVTVHFDYDPEK